MKTKYFFFCVAALLLLILTAMPSYSQIACKDRSATLFVHPEAGYLRTSLIMSQRTDGARSSAYINGNGAYAGLGLDQLLYATEAGQVLISTAILFDWANIASTGNHETIDWNMYYLSVPLLLKCRLPIQKGSIHIAAGPKLNAGLSSKANYISGTEPVREDLFSTESGMRRIDAQLYLETGFTLLPRLELKAGYGLGLTNLTPLYSSRMRHDEFYAGLVVYFNK